ncbi:MAG: class IV adenylate cyclase [Bacteroidota bacterium]
MGVNVEIKARVRNLEELTGLAEKITDRPAAVIKQEDIFFNTAGNRLKLRIFSEDKGELIYYERNDQPGPKRSDYYISETHDPQSLKDVLQKAYGIRGTVKKIRTLYMCDNTRIHVDRVEGLGNFMELEVVLNDGQSEADGDAISNDIMSRLNIKREDLLDNAYIDMISPLQHHA